MSHGPSTLGSMITSSLCAGFRHQRRDVVEPPGRVEAVDARPQAGLAEVELAGHGDEAGAGLLLLGGRDRVLEVAEHDVDLLDGVLELGADLLVVRRHEVDHALDTHGKLAVGLGSADGEGGEMLRGVRVTAIGLSCRAGLRAEWMLRRTL